MTDAAGITNWELDIPAGNGDPSSYYATPTPSEELIFFTQRLQDGRQQTVTMTLEQAGEMYRKLGELLGLPE